MGNGSYSLKLNDVSFATIEDPIGSKSILLIRSYGGFFQDLTLQRASKPIVPSTGKIANKLFLIYFIDLNKICLNINFCSRD